MVRHRGSHVSWLLWVLLLISVHDCQYICAIHSWKDSFLKLCVMCQMWCETQFTHSLTWSWLVEIVAVCCMLYCAVRYRVITRTQWSSTSRHGTGPRTSGSGVLSTMRSFAATRWNTQLGPRIALSVVARRSGLVILAPRMSVLVWFYRALLL